MTSTVQIAYVLGVMLGRLGCGIALLDVRRQTVFANGAGAAHLRLVLGETAADEAPGEMRDIAAGVREEVRNEIDRLLAAPDAPVDRLPRPFLFDSDAEGRAVAYVLPLAISPGDGLTSSHERPRVAILFLDHRERQQPLDAEIVRHLLGLTLGEARVASLVAAGRSPRDAAQTLGLTEGTVRTVLKRVFAKARVSRQSELAILLAALALREPRWSNINNNLL